MSVLLKVRKVPQGLTPALDPSDPFADEDKERQQVEALARKFEGKYVRDLLYLVARMHIPPCLHLHRISSSSSCYVKECVMGCLLTLH